MEQLPLLDFFYDTETTGFPRSAGWLDPDQPHLIQFGYILSTESTIFAEGSIIVKPDTAAWDMNPHAEKVHGLSKQKIIAKGTSAREVARFIQSLLPWTGVKVAHNAAFDQKMMAILFARAGLDFQPFFENVFCTQRESKELCGLKTKTGSPKMPKLEELHEFLFNVGVLGTHDALSDAHIMRRCYYELKKRGL